MTNITVDKHFSTTGTSTAIQAVYYSTEESKIFFKFNSGALAGYAGVGPDIFAALYNINSNRLLGDETASVGSYYNQFFRNTGYFQGVDTSDLDITVLDEEEAVEQAPVARRFGIGFILDQQEVSFNVFGSDENDVLLRFNQAVECFGWKNVKITSVTRFFD